MKIRSIFGRQFISYMGMLLLSLGLLGITLISFYRAHITDEKIAMLETQAGRIAQIYRDAYSERSGTFFLDIDTQMRVRDELLGYQDYLQTVGIVANGQSVIIGASDSIFDNVSGKSLPDELVGQLAEGSVTTIGGLTELLPPGQITVTVPVTHDEMLLMSVSISSSMDEIHETMGGIFGIMLWCFLATAAFATLLIYLTSKAISKPIQGIRDAAKLIAAGDFDRRLELHSEDEIGQLAGSFNEMADSLQNQEKTRREFISDISHDLRSPLTSMRGFVKALLDGTAPPEKRERYLQIVLDESDRMAKLADDILALNSLQSGTPETQPERFELNALIRKIMPMFESGITAKHIETTLKFAADESWITSDPEKLRRVIQNLLDNALKFTGDGGSLEIETEQADGKMFIYVRDSGVGISEEQQKRIFERFYKTDSSRGAKGSGLGLAIVREYMWALGGSVSVKSRPEGGSEFKLEIGI